MVHRQAGAPYGEAGAGNLQIASDLAEFYRNQAVIKAAIAEPFTSMKLATYDYVAWVRDQVLVHYLNDPAMNDPQCKDLLKMRAWGEERLVPWGGAWAQNVYAVAAGVDTAFYEANRAFITRALARESVALSAADEALYQANKAHALPDESEWKGCQQDA